MCAWHFCDCNIEGKKNPCKCFQTQKDTRMNALELNGEHSLVGMAHSA